jgi:hypothetical protein
VVGLVMVVSLSAGAASMQPLETPNRVYTDPAGDAKGGPDFRKLTIGTGALVKMTTGTVLDVVHFEYTVTNLDPSRVAGAVDGAVLTWLDTNKNGKDDYLMVFGIDANGHYADLLKLPQQKSVPKSPTMDYAYRLDGKTHTFMLSSADIGGATSFDFTVKSSTWDEGGKQTFRDDAPSIFGSWSYSLGIKPVIGTVTARPVTPVAGKPLTLTLPITRSDTGMKLTTGATLVSNPTIGGVAVPHRDQLANGVATIRLSVPASAKGQQLRVQLTIRLDNQSATKLTTLPVR